MQASQIPAKFPVPFASSAASGFIRTIPQASQIGITNGAASLTDGFVPLNFLPVGSGGVPPFGQDFNGILNQITAWNQWQGAGGLPIYDGTFSASIGGYPKGAILAATSVTGVWLNTVDGNTANPDAAGAGWVLVSTGNVHFGIASGAGDAMTVAATPVMSAASGGGYQAGSILIVKTPASANATTTPVINANGVGNITVKKRTIAALAVGDLTPETWTSMFFDGTNCVLLDLALSDIVALIIANIPAIVAAVPSISPPRNIVSESTAGTYTFTVPAGVTWILVTVVGGGGGGAGAGGSSTWSAGGGGSGGTCIAWIEVEPEQVITYIVGPGGAGGAQGNGAVGANGSTSSFGPSMMATGGQGGTGGTATSAGGLPGVGSGGQINLAGSPGGDGNPLNAAVQGGGGGASSQGGGGRTSTITGTQANGLAPGSGAGGIWLSDPVAQTGGNGAAGLVSIQF